jgi:hypothetical protein
MDTAVRYQIHGVGIWVINGILIPLANVPLGKPPQAPEHAVATYFPKVLGEHPNAV